jgi:hypothetical protein
MTKLAGQAQTVARAGTVYLEGVRGVETFRIEGSAKQSPTMTLLVHTVDRAKQCL